MKNFRNYFFLKKKKFDKKVVVDKSTYRHEWVNSGQVIFAGEISDDAGDVCLGF